MRGHGVAVRLGAALGGAALMISLGAGLGRGAVSPAMAAGPQPRAALHGRGHTSAADAAQHAADARAEAALLDKLTHQPLQPGYTFYTVRPGDTVEGLARRFHDSAWLLRRRNGGLWTMSPGQQIRVLQWPFGKPYYVTRSYVTDRPQFYDVRPGDTLSAIAATLHTDTSTLASENNLGDGDLIYAGQRLVLHHYSTHMRRVLVPGVPAERLKTGLMLTDVANLAGVDAALVKGLAWRETGWKMVRGSSGEIGMMQIMPDMARWIQHTLVGYNLDPNVPVNNALEGTLLLGYYLDITKRDVHKALALYHSGDTLPSRRNGLYIKAIELYRDYFYHHPRAGF